MALCRISGDDLTHVVAVRDSHGRGHAGPVAVCGRPAAEILEPGYVPGYHQGCHICLPFLAHPLAAVWDACRRLDQQHNGHDSNRLEIRQ